MIVYFSGGLVDAKEARISALSTAFTHGPNVYETLRGYRHYDSGQLNLFRLNDHLTRFCLSMRALRFEHVPSPDAIARAIRFAIVQPADVDVSEVIVRPTVSNMS